MVTATLVYPEHMEITPSDFLVFVEFDGFLEDWKHFSLTDDDLLVTQICITGMPEIGVVVDGTEELREVELAAETTGGRNLILRYVYFDDFATVLMISLHEGHVEFSESELNEIRDLIRRDRVAMESRRI